MRDVKRNKKKEKEIEGLTQMTCRRPGCQWSGSISEFIDAHFEYCEAQFEEVGKVLNDFDIHEKLTAEEQKEFEDRPDLLKGLQENVKNGSL